MTIPLCKVHRSESRENIGFAPIGLDEPYRVIISEDPIGLAGGINKYVYVGNQPINWTDPRGWDRYAPCEGLNCIQKFFCKKVTIDILTCGGSTKEVLCCEAEKADCINKIPENDPQLAEKAHACETLYQCEGKAR